MFHKPKWLNHLLKRPSDESTISAVPDDLWQGLVRLQRLLDIRASEDLSVQFSASVQSNIRTDRLKVAARLSRQIVSSLECIVELVGQLDSSVYPFILLKSRIEPLLDLGSGGPSVSDLPTQNLIVSRLREIHIELARFVLSTKTFLDEPMPEAILSFPSRPSALPYGSLVLEDLGIQCCKQNTRVSELEYLQNWVLDSKAHGMQVVSGAAGVGKTTVAYSLCRWMSDSNVSAVSCFCSPYGLDDNNSLDVLVSISHQLARQWPAFRWALAQELKGRTEVFTIPYLEAVRRLILFPSRRSSHIVCKPIVIVIDGLHIDQSIQPEHSLLEALLEVSVMLPLRVVYTAATGSNLYQWIKYDARQGYLAELCLDSIDGSTSHVGVGPYLEATSNNVQISESLTQHLGSSPIHTVEHTTTPRQATLTDGTEIS
ncbi:Vegetative incompatibility protein HET-E-1 [Ceratobasidium sp. AG-Ba]|nr:Vegetative incompatibility protein HET-E-1 [Ceratobasidium sp. AG-Ba]